MHDERRSGYPFQNRIDRLESRLPLYVNAKDCALDWIGESAERASASGLRAIFFAFHATFYDIGNGKYPVSNRGIGEYYGGDSLRDRIGIEDPYEPLFDRLRHVAFDHPDLMFYIIHSDGHRSVNMRLFPDRTNYVSNEGSTHHTKSHQNIMVHQIEGSSRGLTMYSKFTVDSNAFQPVTLKEQWSESAYMTEPKGHTYDPY